MFNTAVSDYTNIYLSNQNFTFAYRVEDNNGKMYTNTSIVETFLNYFYYQMDEITGEWKSESGDIKLKKTRCSDLPYTKEKEAYYNTILENWLCIDFDSNNILGGNWDGKFIRAFWIDTRQCQNSTENNNSCLPYEIIKKTFQNELTSNNLFFSYLYLQDLPTMSNYENPIRTKLINKYALLNLQLAKSTFQTFKKVNVQNDNGWIFSSSDTSTVYAEDNKFSDFSTKDPVSQSIVYTYVMYFGKGYDTYVRTYTKMQEVFAQIGGFCNFFYVVLLFLYDSMSSRYKSMIINEKILFLETKGKKTNITNFSNLKSDNKSTFIINNFFKDSMIESKNPNSTNKIVKEIEIKKKPKTIKKSKFNKKITFLFYLKYITCQGRMTMDELNIMNTYTDRKKYIDNIFNIYTFIKFFTEFQYLKKILLNENQEIALKCLKPKYEKEEEDDSLKALKLEEYFAELNNNNRLKGLDSKLYDLLNDEDFRRVEIDPNRSVLENQHG